MKKVLLIFYRDNFSLPAMLRNSLERCVLIKSVMKHSQNSLQALQENGRGKKKKKKKLKKKGLATA